MSHIDEGALHAYLDGALDEYPTEEAERVREHLEVCADCRERLEQERGLRDEASAILALAAPEVDVPTFEELRAFVRANAPRPSPISVRLYRVGWAASVVLALGTGWMLRGGQVVPVSSPTGARVESARVQESPALVESAGDRAGVDELERATEPAAASGRANEMVVDEVVVGTAVTAQNRLEVAQVPAAAGALAPDVQVDDQVAARTIVADQDASAADPADSRLDEPVADAAQRRRVEADRVAQAPPAEPEPAPTAVREQVGAAAGAAPEPERRAAQADVVTSLSARSPTTTLGSAFAPDFGDTRDEVADEEESYSLVVPNLQVIDVRFRGAGVQPEGQVVRQLLASGDTLEVIHLPPDMDPRALEDAPEGRTELVVQLAPGWIVMRAPLSEEELLQLLERLLAPR